MKKFLLLFVLLGLILPVFVFALDIVFENPLGTNIFRDIVDKLTGLFFYIALGLVPLLVVIAAVIFVSAGGNPAQADLAKKIIILAFIILAVALLSRAIIYISTQILNLNLAPLEEASSTAPTAQKCSDGTSYSQCSSNKPEYCEEGVLVDKASLCGCPPDYKNSNNECEKIIPFSLLLDVFVIQDDGTLVQSGNIIDVPAVSRKFYSLYPNKDNYDFLNIFTTFDDPSKPHLHYTVKNNVTGIGGGRPDVSSAFGSYKLLGVNFFDTTFTSDQLNSSEQAIKSNFNIINHELSHQWLMYIGNDFGFSDDGVHYGRWVDTSFVRDGEEWVDTNGGGIWKDNQNGTLSISGFSAKRGFCKLSLYLMGLIPSSDVPDLNVVVPKDPTDNVSRTIVGAFKKVSVNDVVARYGERNPLYQNSQKNFRMAYILLSKKGETPAEYQLNAINYIAQNYPDWWNSATYGKSTINQ